MVKFCCAYGCTNEWTPAGNIKFHKFPIKNPQKLKLWIQAVHRKNFNPTASTVLCSEHFKEDDYLESSLRKNILKRDAVPSIFKLPEHMAKHSPKRRKLLSREESYVETFREEENVLEKEAKSRPAVRDIATQTSHLKTETEIKLHRQVKRRNVKLTLMKNLIKHLKDNKKCSSNIEDIVVTPYYLTPRIS